MPDVLVASRRGFNQLVFTPCSTAAAAAAAAAAAVGTHVRVGADGHTPARTHTRTHSSIFDVISLGNIVKTQDAPIMFRPPGNMYADLRILPAGQGRSTKTAATRGIPPLVVLF